MSSYVSYKHKQLFYTCVCCSDYGRPICKQIDNMSKRFSFPKQLLSSPFATAYTSVADKLCIGTTKNGMHILSTR